MTWGAGGPIWFWDWPFAAAAWLLLLGLLVVVAGWALLLVVASVPSVGVVVPPLTGIGLGLGLGLGLELGLGVGLLGVCLCPASTLCPAACAAPCPAPCPAPSPAPSPAPFPAPCPALCPAAFNALLLTLLLPPVLLPLLLGPVLNRSILGLSAGDVMRPLAALGQKGGGLNLGLGMRPLFTSQMHGLFAQGGGGLLLICPFVASDKVRVGAFAMSKGSDGDC